MIERNIKSLKKYEMIVSSQLSIKPITDRDITTDYIVWMNDKEITLYTEQKYKKHNFESIKNFIIQTNNSSSNLLYGIFFENKHVGNIKLGLINVFHKTADLSYLIGSKKNRSKGIATNSISVISNLAFKDLKLSKISAGVYSNNVASIRVLEKNKFQREGIRLKQYIFNKERIDGFIYGKFS